MIKFPFQNAQELNLDWLMQMIRKLLDFLPVDQGAVGDVLHRGTDRAVWLPPVAVSLDVHDLTSASEVDTADELPIYDVSAQGNYKTTVQDILDLAGAAPVSSVNGQTGAVVLDASDVGALPDTYAAPVDSVNGQTGTVVLDASDVGALPDTYSAPVSSVNSKTGAVVLDASDVGALPDTYTAPVTSVNGQTGDVIISGSSISFGAEQSLSLTVPAALTLVNSNLYGQVSDDGKFLRIWGTVRFMQDTDNGWYNIPITGITVSPAPAANKTFACVGIEQHMYNNDYSVIDIANNRIENPAIVVDTSGNVFLRIYIIYGTTEVQNWKLFPIILPL